METQLTIIKKILEEFEREDIRYCILRNYEFLFDDSFMPESLDTVVAVKDIHKVHEILVHRGFGKRKPQFSLKHQAYFTFVNLKPVTFDIQVGGVYWNDMLYLDEIILTNRVKKEFFYVPSDNDTFIMLAAHSILGKRYFKPKYWQILSTLTVDEQYVTKELSRIFSTSKAGHLIKNIKENKVQNINPYLLLIHFLIKEPLRLWTLAALFLRWIQWKKFLYSYPLIGIIGPDGAGKSTLALELHKYLKRYKRTVQVVYTGRGRGQLLPFRKLGNAYKHRERKNDAQLQSQSWTRKILYIAAAPLFTFDLWLRYIFKIMPLRKCRTIVITDRYCTDILLMEHVPLWFKIFLFRLFPRPTMTFYLYNLAEVLHERRPKESILELERQMQLFERMLPYLHARKIITDEKEKVQEEVIITVLEYIYRQWY